MCDEKARSISGFQSRATRSSKANLRHEIVGKWLRISRFATGEHQQSNGNPFNPTKIRSKREKNDTVYICILTLSQCLKCSAVFEQRLSHDGRFSPPTCCPNCHNKDCVVQIQSENPSSSFFPYAAERNASTPPLPLLVTKPNADVASVDDVNTSLSGQASP